MERAGRGREPGDERSRRQGGGGLEGEEAGGGPQAEPAPRLQAGRYRPDGADLRLGLLAGGFQLSARQEGRRRGSRGSEPPRPVLASGPAVRCVESLWQSVFRLRGGARWGV